VRERLTSTEYIIEHQKSEEAHQTERLTLHESISAQAVLLKVLKWNEPEQLVSYLEFLQSHPGSFHEAA
jgi:hypothetical protein